MDLEVYAQKWGVTKEYLMTNDFFVVAKKTPRLKLYNMAQQIRQEMGLVPDEKFLPLPFIEHYLMGKYPYLEFEVVPENEWEQGESVHGFCSISESEPITIYIREDVYNGAMNGISRDVETIIHEGAHMVLLYNFGLECIETKKYEYVKDFLEGDAEAQADALVSFLLCPNTMIAKNRTVTKLMKASGATKSLVIKRLNCYKQALRNKENIDKKGGEEYLRRHLNNPSFVIDTLLRIEKDSL